MSINTFRTFHLIQILENYDRSSLPLDALVRNYFRSHTAIGSKDRGFIATTLYTLVRWKSLIDSHLTPPYGWKQRLEFYLLHPLDKIPTTNLSPHLRVSCPEWLFSRLVFQYSPQEAERLCLISNEEAPAAIRANLIKTDRSTLFERLNKTFPMRISSISPVGLVFEKRMNFFELPEFKEGLFEVQDEGSQCLALLATLSPGDQILDFCAGSGGKSLAFAPLTKGKGQIYLHDVRSSALEEAKKRLRRAGVQNAQYLFPDSPHMNKLKGKMDWVFVDVPCSGTGTLRRNPDLKWKLSSEGVDELVLTQRMIFEKALAFLSPKGRIIYGTCSLLAEENEQQIEKFLELYPLELAAPILKLLPVKDGNDGFFGTVLRHR